MEERLNKKILVIDDEPDITELMEEELVYYGFDVMTAASGNAALRILDDESNEFDAIISDFKMPDGNGKVVLDYVNTLELRPLFYFVSGQADMSSKEALSKGVTKFFYKPFDIDELIDAIKVDLVV